MQQLQKKAGSGGNPAGFLKASEKRN